MCIRKLFGLYNPSAKVVDNTLILSLPGADAPVVWRMGLGFVRASAIEVRDNPAGDATLLLKTPEKEHFEIADFSSRKDAIHALLVLTTAMHDAPVTPKQTGTRPTKKMYVGKWLPPIIMTALFITALLYLWSFMAPSARDAQSILSATPKTIEFSTSQRSGSAISADAFLEGR